MVSWHVEDDEDDDGALCLSICLRVACQCDDILIVVHNSLSPPTCTRSTNLIRRGQTVIVL